MSRHPIGNELLHLCIHLFVSFLGKRPVAHEFQSASIYFIGDFVFLENICLLKTDKNIESVVSYYLYLKKQENNRTAILICVSYIRPCLKIDIAGTRNKFKAINVKSSMRVGGHI